MKHKRAHKKFKKKKKYKMGQKKTLAIPTMLHHGARLFFSSYTLHNSYNNTLYLQHQTVYEVRSYLNQAHT